MNTNVHNSKRPEPVFIGLDISVPHPTDGHMTTCGNKQDLGHNCIPHVIVPGVGSSANVM